MHRDASHSRLRGVGGPQGVVDLLHAPAQQKLFRPEPKHHGFWELGRFAGAYAQFYGEPRSRTLRRPAV